MAPYAAPSIGPSGLTIPGYEDILSDNLQGFLNLFGQNQYVGRDSAIFQLLSILSLKQSDTMEAAQLAYNQRSPLTAVGAGLDGIVKLNGIARAAYTYSTALETITGTLGTVIANGFVQDVNGNQWALPGLVTIPGGGSIAVTVTCTTPGNVVAEPGEIAVIATPVGGWLTATNASASTPGLPVESDSKLRARQAISVALPSRTMLAGTVAEIAAIPGVTRYNVLENPTGSTDTYGNPAHSVTAVVEGGTNLAVATAIYDNRGIGCLTNGKVSGSSTAQTVTVNVTDPNTGYVMAISFLTPLYVPIYVSLSVHKLAGATSATLAAIVTAVVNYLNSLQIGESVTLSALYAAAMAVTPNLSQPLFAIEALTLDTSPTPTGTTDIAIAFQEVAQGIDDGVHVIVTSV